MRLSKYYAMRFASWLCDYLVLFAVPVLAYSQTSDVRWSGAAIFFQWGPRLLGLSTASLWVDGISPRRILIGSDGVRVATATVAGLLMILYPGAALPVLLAFAALVGICFELTFVAGEKLGRSQVVPSEQERFQSRLTALEQVSVVLGPALAGAALSFPPFVLMWVTAALFGVSLTMSITTPPSSNSGVSAGRRSMRETLRIALADHILRRIILVAMSSNFLLALINGSAADVTSHRFGTTTRELSLMYATASILSVVGLLVFPRLTQRTSLARTGRYVGVGMALSAGAVAVAHREWIFTAGLSAFLLSDAFFSVYLRVARVRRVAPETYAATVGLFGMLIIIPMPLAGLTLAIVGNILRPELLIGAFATAVLGLAASVLPTNRELIKLPRASPTDVSAAS